MTAHTVYIVGRLVCGICGGVGVGVMAWMVLGVWKDDAGE